MHLTIYGDPRTKKNSARILKSRSGGRFVAPSKAYVDYETDCLRQIKRPRSPISARVNVRCVYYMKTARRVDLANLIEATTDILVKAHVLEDDNSTPLQMVSGNCVQELCNHVCTNTGLPWSHILFQLYVYSNFI